VVATSSDPRLGEIRLAWWRDRLDDLDTRGPANEPRLIAANRYLMPVTTGAALSTIASAWVPLLDPFPWGEHVADGLRRRGALLFLVGGQILGCEGAGAEAAGVLWSLADGAFHCSDPSSREFLLREARRAIADVPRRISADLRPLTVLAALAAHDLLRRGRLSRVAAGLAHRLRGVIPR
jgi:phytoene synthase